MRTLVATRRGWRVALTAVALSAVAAACGTSGPSGSGGATGTTSATTSTTKAPPAVDAGTWSLVVTGPNPMSKPVVWTGHEVIAARAGCCAEIPPVALSAYDPVAGTWRQLPTAPLTPRIEEAAAWTGTELVVAGGLASAAGIANENTAPAVDAAAWGAASNSWKAIASLPVTLGEATMPTAVWTGHEVLVWSSDPGAPNRAGREVVLAYDPTTDHWRTLPSSGLTPRSGAVVVWTGRELVVWGGRNSDLSVTYADGARLDPATGTWRRLPPAPVPGRGDALAVWSGHEVLLWGGSRGAGTQIGQGAAYDPATNQWRSLPLSPLRAKAAPMGAWTGRVFVVVGGAAGATMPAPGPGAAVYDPATNQWTALPAAPPYPPGSVGASAPVTADQRAYGDAVWTGHQVVVIGGLDFTQQASRPDGLAWTPAT